MAVKVRCSVTLYKVIDIDKVTRYYLLQSSTLAAPSKPADGAAISSKWSKTEPSYTSGSTMTLYFVDQTVMSNGAIKYSEVSKSSSYEAAKEAWNKAKNAQDTANSVNTKINNLQVGGRNLLKDSHKTAVTYTYPSSNYKDQHSWNTSIPLNGDTYTLSFWGKSTVANDKIRVHFYNPSNIVSVKGSQGQSSTASDGLCDFTLSTTLTKYWVTYTIPKGGNSTKSVIIPRLMAGSGTGTVTIQWEKLEEGNIATDWTPAPEDLESRVTAAETNISSNAKEIKLKASKTEVTTLSNDLNVYKDSTTTMIQNINGWQFDWSKLIRTDDADVANHTDYITLQNGDIILGESASDLKLKIGNDAIQFKGTSDTEVTPDPDATAWITGQKLNINEGEIHTTLKVGNLQFAPRPNGNFCITIV